MKISPRHASTFINNPDPNIAVILVYGPNTGLVKDHAKTLSGKIVKDINDPFNVAAFIGCALNEDPAKFIDETSAISMMGGQRLILIKDAIDSNTLHLKNYCESPNPNCTIIIEAGDLKPSSSLRKFAENHDKAAAIACYMEEERNIGSKIRELCQHAGYGIAPDALRLLSEALAGDSALLRSEVEKLITFKGFSEDYQGFTGEPLRQKIGEITTEDILACNPNMREISLDELITYTTLGNVQQAHSTAKKMMDEGTAPIAIFRALLRHFRRLHISLCRMQEGENPQSAMGKLKPPVFFKYKQEFVQQLSLWRKHIVEATIQKIVKDEAESKKGTNAAETICLHLILNIARTASILR